MITIFAFAVGSFGRNCPPSFAIPCPNLDTARALYDTMVAGGWVMSTERP